MYTALYRSERPEVFSEILGQEHIVKILKHQIETKTVSHAYVFCGTRGTGKTTTARILAKALNCLSDDENKPCGTCENCVAIKEGRFIDVIEIDAASNNGVENIREINESVNYPPSVGSKKVYIIDEVHMLSTGAFNALLKTLEEPPENVIFILATTEPQKLPATILSRCMRLDFRRVPETVIGEGMKKICHDRDVEISEDALKLLVSNADGSVRDGLSILEQCLATGEKYIDREMLLDFLGTVGDDFFIELTDKVMTEQISEGLLMINDIILEGKDSKQLMKDWNTHYRNLLITKFVRTPEDMLNMSEENIQRLKKQSEQITTEEIDHAIITLSKTINEARWSTQPRILLELALVQIATGSVEMPTVNKSVKVKSNTKPLINEKDTGKAVDFVPKKSNKNIESKKDSNPTGKNFDLQKIWYEVIEKGASSEPSLNVARNSTNLIDINDVEFVISVKNDIIGNVINSHEKLFSDLLCDITGEKRKIKIINAQERILNEANNDSVEKLASEISDKLNINVTIE